MTTYCPLSCQNQKKKANEVILHKVKKVLFLGLLAQVCPQFFFSKIGFRHILGIVILPHCAKNQKKLMRQSRKKLVKGKW